MKHTFLFEPGVWSGTGTLWRADGEPIGAQAHTEIAHRKECWLLSGKLKVLGSPPTEFVQAYLIEVPRPGSHSLKWTFESAMFGKLEGAFATVGDSILAMAGCKATGYHATEHFGRIDPRTYRATGAMLLKEQLVYSWDMTHRRQGPGADGSDLRF
jgi:hypothetical protein